MNIIFPGYFAGLSVGVFCIGLCLPVFLPILLSQPRTTKNSFLIVFEFSLGRLLGYLLFGLIFGWLGVLIKNQLVHSIVALVNMWMGITMILYSLSTIDKKFCPFFSFSKIKIPFLLGFFTGVNACPPFISSLSYVFNLKKIIASVLYFLMFFLGTSTYIIPSAFLGVFSKIGLIQRAARISGIFVGLYFVYQSFSRVF